MTEARLRSHVRYQPHRYARKCKKSGEIEYHTLMSERARMKVRRLPDGEFSDAFQVSAGGRFLEFESSGPLPPLGSLLEIEHGSMLYWGELQHIEGYTARVFVEHSLEGSHLQPIREIWGD